MLSQHQKQKLMSNWGYPADTMTCKAEVRVYDPASRWECYIYALNPHDQQEICCIINGFYVEICRYSIQELYTLYNQHGEPVQVDYEYVPREAAEIYRMLKQRNIDEFSRY
jgi:hypothetical protein